jgi:hypothetical protein
MNQSYVIKHNGSYIYQYPCESSVQCFPIEIVLIPGIWKIECWGASGGDSFSQSINFVYLGGRGGYSTAYINVTKDTKAFLNIGGRGLSNQTSSTNIVEGGFNGGGKGYVGLYTGASGGGSTDVRIINNSIENRIIVAGAGGGGASLNNDNTLGGYGGHGGGLNGLDSGIHSTGFFVTYTPGRGGQQDKGGDGSFAGYEYSENGTLWKGGNAETSSRSAAGGGGGGYYGGSGGASTGGGGGSGFTDSSLIDGETLDGGNVFPSPFGTSEQGHVGNGVVKLTLFPIRRPSIHINYVKHWKQKIPKTILLT